MGKWVSCVDHCDAHASAKAVWDGWNSAPFCDVSYEHQKTQIQPHQLLTGKQLQPQHCLAAKRCVDTARCPLRRGGVAASQAGSGSVCCWRAWTWLDSRSVSSFGTACCLCRTADSAGTGCVFIICELPLEMWQPPVFCVRGWGSRTGVTGAAPSTQPRGMRHEAPHEWPIIPVPWSGL